MERSRNLAARAGRWSALHRRKAIAGWFVFVVLAFVAGSAAGTKELEDEDSGVGESREADQALADAIRERVRNVLVVQARVELVPWGTLARSEYKSKLVER